MPTHPHILITAGPTHEPIDAVRYIANRSSGRMGLALAEAAREAGCAVTLLLGPVDLAPPAGVAVHRFTTHAELRRLLAEHFERCDGLIMAAAVADYYPVSPVDQKLLRQGERLTIELAMTPDLVAELAARRRPGQWIVGFALEEDEQLKRRALEKLRRKDLDAIVANPLRTMGADDVEATVYTAGGQTLHPGAGAASKHEFTRWLIDWLLSRRP